LSGCRSIEGRDMNWLRREGNGHACNGSGHERDFGSSMRAGRGGELADLGCGFGSEEVVDGGGDVCSSINWLSSCILF